MDYLCGVHVNIIMLVVHLRIQLVSLCLTTLPWQFFRARFHQLSLFGKRLTRFLKQKHFVDLRKQ